MALLATNPVTFGGVTESLTAAAGGGDTFTPGPNMYLVVNNASGGAITVTVVTPGTVRGLAISDAGGSVTAGTKRHFRISPADFFADPTTGLGNITYSGVTSVTVGVFQVQDTP